MNVYQCICMYQLCSWGQHIIWLNLWNICIKVRMNLTRCTKIDSRHRSYSSNRTRTRRIFRRILWRVSCCSNRPNRPSDNRWWTTGTSLVSSSSRRMLGAYDSMSSDLLLLMLMEGNREEVELSKCIHSHQIHIKISCKRWMAETCEHNHNNTSEQQI